MLCHPMLKRTSSCSIQVLNQTELRDSMTYYCTRLADTLLILIHTAIEFIIRLARKINGKHPSLWQGKATHYTQAKDGTQTPTAISDQAAEGELIFLAPGCNHHHKRTMARSHHCGWGRPLPRPLCQKVMAQHLTALND
jgi:hypothetical protein